MDAHDRVACARLRCTLAAGVCATRHAARIASGAGAGAPRFYPCHSCPVGAAVQAELEAAGWRRPRDTIPAVVLEPAQLRARARWIQSFPANAEPADRRLEPLREAALATPDDRGVGIDAG